MRFLATKTKERKMNYLPQLVENVVSSVKQLVENILTPGDNHHGLSHLFDVEREVSKICNHFSDITENDIILVRTAALVHDTGYAAYSKSWSQDRREHVLAGIEFADRQLPHVSSFFQDKNNLYAVLFLIAHHDDTNYMYPSYLWDGFAKPVDLGDYAARLDNFISNLSDESRQRVHLLLKILQEADAFAATGTNGAKRTFDYSIGRGLPVFAQANPLNAWAWEESAIGNVRIAAKRLLTDAVSIRGKQQAVSSYNEMEAFVENQCKLHKVPYSRELLTHLVNGNYLVETFQLLRFEGFQHLEQLLRKIPLNGDENILPYATASIQAKKLQISKLRPTAYYALENKLDSHRGLHSDLEHKYKISLFDLSGLIKYYRDGKEITMAPPIVETYFEASENQVVPVIVDGLHRIMVAKELGLESVWVIEISDVPPKYPLVPLPLVWADVATVKDVPPKTKKRKFRFPTLESFPDISNISDVSVTEENFDYFFYRDLSKLGSEGIRKAPK